MKLYGLALCGIWHFRLPRSSQITETLDNWDQSVHDWMEALITAEAQICHLRVEGEDLAVGGLVQTCADPQKNRQMMLTTSVRWKYLACRKKGKQAAWKCRMTFPS